MRKIIFSIAVIGVLLGIYFMVSQPKNGDESGFISIVVINQEGTEIINDTFVFDEEKSLYSLLYEEYNIGCANMSYLLDTTCDHSFINGHILLQIESVSTDWTNSYLRIMIDDIESNYGVDFIMLEDGVTYKFIYTELGGDGS